MRCFPVALFFHCVELRSCHVGSPLSNSYVHCVACPLNCIPINTLRSPHGAFPLRSATLRCVTGHATGNATQEERNATGNATLRNDNAMQRQHNATGRQRKGSTMQRKRNRNAAETDNANANKT